MPENKTSVNYHYNRLVGGECIIAENNAYGSVINLQPEMALPDSYRGNFHVINTQDTFVSVIDSSLADPDEEEITFSNAGTVLLRWQKIIQDSKTENFYSIACYHQCQIPSSPELEVTEPGWLLLTLSRSSTAADISFSDDYLGKVNLKLQWQIADKLPDVEASSTTLVVAALIPEEDGSNVEVFQQHHGIAEMWIPLEIEEIESSSSSVSSSSSSSSSSSRSSSYSNSSSSSTSSSSSSIIEPPLEWIVVAFEYTEIHTSYHNGEEISSHLNYLLTGSMPLPANYPANGLTATLSGWKTYTDAMDGETTREEFVSNITFFNNTTTGNWDFYMAEADDWGVYLDFYDEETDTRYQTPTYNYLPYASSPNAPLGMIQVQHSIIHGTTFEPPIEKISSNLQIHLYI